MTTRQEMIEHKYIVARRHLTEPLTIYNYTERAQFDHVWNEHTLECRGLIVHDDGRVIARPFRKFFNRGEPLAWKPSPVAGFGPGYRVADKVDGALGISYREPSTGKIAIASRGAFHSEQAIEATKIWREKYADVEPEPGHTWLFEIIYPTTKANRHVLSYGDMRDLVLLAILDTATGADVFAFAHVAAAAGWTGPFADTFEPVPIEKLSLDRQNAEGFVLIEHPPPFDRPAGRVKIKQEDYKARHKLLDGITPHRIWEAFATARDNSAGCEAFLRMIEGVPDEYHAEAKQIADGLLDRFVELTQQLRAAYERIGNSLLVPPDGGAPTRKDWALAIQREPEELRGLLFLVLSNKATRAAVWERIEP